MRLLANAIITTANEKAEAGRQQQLATLEASVTSRHLRAAALGDAYAIEHIQTVEEAISALGVRS
jgi:hypothetical protein